MFKTAQISPFKYHHPVPFKEGEFEAVWAFDVSNSKYYTGHVHSTRFFLLLNTPHCPKLNVGECGRYWVEEGVAIVTSTSAIVPEWVLSGPWAVGELPNSFSDLQHFQSLQVSKYAILFWLTHLLDQQIRVYKFLGWTQVGQSSDFGAPEQKSNFRPMFVRIQTLSTVCLSPIFVQSVSTTAIKLLQDLKFWFLSKVCPSPMFVRTLSKVKKNNVSW